MENRKSILTCILCLILLAGLAVRGEAFYIEKDKTLEFSAKVQTRATVRLQESDTEQNGKGYSFPEIDVGDVVQHRNLAIIEVNHDLKNLAQTLDLLYPLRALDIEATYHLLGRFLYEGIYDYGPEVFQDIEEADPDNIDEFKQSYDLWEAYADFQRGSLFVRIGRQNLAWGETDIFRLLDYINPLDNTFGGPFEDLDDRRIPLWMIRSSHNLGNLGPLSSLTLEGFLVPGPVDAHVAPWAPRGTPYAAPLPSLFAPSLRIITPKREWSESRWGVRMQSVVAGSLNLAVAHYQTFLDMPTLRSKVIGSPPVLADLNALQLWGEFPEVRITGASMNYWESVTDTVLRGEVAWFWKEPVFIPEINNSTLFGPQLELPDFILDALPGILGVDIRNLGLKGLPLNPQSGSIPRKDILRYMIGLDKSVWIRPLNKLSTFFVSCQYFGQWVPDYDGRMRQAALVYPSLKDYPKVEEFEHTFTLMVNTTYLSGKLQPLVAGAYDPRGAILLSPSVSYLWEPFRFMIQYSSIQGPFTNFGLFRDRDQVAFIFTYLLN
ncbi:MAG: DUF1302 family protein [Acidobacteriota bacterium]